MVTPAALSSDSNRSSVVICNYYIDPITADIIPSEDIAFTTCVDPISPPLEQSSALDTCFTQEMVEAPGTAPGSALLIPQYVYRHS